MKIRVTKRMLCDMLFVAGLTLIGVALGLYAYTGGNPYKFYSYDKYLCSFPLGHPANLLSLDLLPPSSAKVYGLSLNSTIGEKIFLSAFKEAIIQLNSNKSKSIALENSLEGLAYRLGAYLEPIYSKEGFLKDYYLFCARGSYHTSFHIDIEAEYPIQVEVIETRDSEEKTIANFTSIRGADGKYVVFESLDDVIKYEPPAEYYLIVRNLANVENKVRFYSVSLEERCECINIEVFDIVQVIIVLGLAGSIILLTSFILQRK